MSNPNPSLFNLDARYQTANQVDTKISNQATADSAAYATKNQLTTFRNSMVVAASLSGDNLVLTDFSGNIVFQGNVRGMQGTPGDVATVTSLGTVTSGAVDLSAYPQGGVILMTLGANLATLTLPTVPLNKACTLELVITQDATGSRTLTLPAGVKASEGNAPALSTAAGAIDTLALVWDTVRWKVRLIERSLA